MDDPLVPHPNVRPRARQLPKTSDSASWYAVSSIAARKLASFTPDHADARLVLEGNVIDCAAYA